MELCPLLKHGLDEDVELVVALVLGSVDPLVVTLAVLQTGQGHLLQLADIIQVPGVVHPRQPEVKVFLLL